MWHHYWFELLKYLLYRLARCIFCVVRDRWWHLVGITEHLDDIQMSALIYKSAHVQKIIYRKTWGKLPSSSGQSEFITVHKGFKDPEYILQDGVALYKLTQSEAIFVESDKGATRHGILLNKGELFNNAKRLITLPLHSFYYVASQMKIPRNVAVFGSGEEAATESSYHSFKDNQCYIALPESHELEDVFKQKQLLAPDQYFKLLQHAIRFFCKSLQEKCIFLITLHDKHVSQALDILHIMPNTRCLFLPDVDKEQKLTKIFIRNILFKGEPSTSSSATLV